MMRRSLTLLAPGATRLKARMEEGFVLRPPRVRLLVAVEARVALGWMTWVADPARTLPATAPRPARTPPLRVMFPAPVAEPVVLLTTRRPPERVVPPV